VGRKQLYEDAGRGSVVVLVAVLLTVLLGMSVLVVELETI
jgi:hypothetical protein